MATSSRRQFLGRSLAAGLAAVAAQATGGDSPPKPSAAAKSFCSHSAAGRWLPAERSTCKDQLTGAEVAQLTNYKGHSHHFYFTNSGWYDQGRKLLFSSDRNNRTNLFGIDLAGGQIEQLTDLEPVALPREVEFFRACKNPTREEAYFWHDRKLMAIDLTTRRARTLHEIGPGWCVSMTNGSADGKHVYFGIWEDLSKNFRVDLLRGYVGFRETFEARPLSKILQVATGDGAARTVHQERYWIGHVNTSPTQRHLLTFCHEGPWNLVDQRIWGLDTDSGKVWKIRPTSGMETVGHEYWYADGVRIGYHGLDAGGKPMLGRIRYDGQDRSETSLPGKTGHIFSHDEHLLVGDGGGDIRLWRRDGGKYQAPRVLCRHESSLRIQQAHPHPRISPDGKYVIFTSDRSGYCNVYRVEIVDFDRLPLADERRT